MLEIEATAQGTRCQQPFFQAIVKLPHELATEIEQAKSRDAGEFHTLETEQLTDRRQLQKSIKL